MNRRKTNLGAIAVVILAASSGVAQAGTIFEFSFTGSPSLANNTGTVTGEIVLSFSGNGVGPADEVVVDSMPAGFPGVPSVPFDATAAPWIVADNLFTVTNGNISSVEFDAAIFRRGREIASFYLHNPEHGPQYGVSGGNQAIAADTVTFSRPAAVPEPRCLTLWGLGLASLAGIAWMKKRKDLRERRFLG